MEPITYNGTCYQICGKPFFLYSGDFHYFRVPRKDWKIRMNIFKEAGGNCLATYIPWLIHEQVEGKIVFSKEPAWLDLEGFFETALDAGLYVIAKPGPYQYSELQYAGIPKWVWDIYPALRAKTIDEKDAGTGLISYLHPLFIEKVKRWYDAVCPIIRHYSTTNGGCIAFFQLDNELEGIYENFNTLDYNAETMGFDNKEGRYPVYLRHTYRNIEDLNRLYGTDYSSFEKVRPCHPSESSESLNNIRRTKDYFDFFMEMIGEYTEVLTRIALSNGIDIPFVHNSAHPEMNGFFLETVKRMGKNFILGSDHYYCLSQEWRQNNPTPQYAIHCFYSLEMLRLMGFPPTVYEMPGGSMSDWPPVTELDAKACYMTNVALGMKGCNFYILTGGPNPPEAGTTSDLYDYGAGIGPENEIRTIYHAQKEVGLFLRERPWLAQARRVTDFNIAIDFEHSRTRKYLKNSNTLKFSGDEAWDFLKKGVLTTAFCTSLSPALCDIDSDDWISDVNVPVLVISSSSMSVEKQKRIAGFIKKGGKAVIAPVIPAFDEKYLLCTILSDFLGVSPVIKGRDVFCRIDILDIKNILRNKEVFFSDPLSAEFNIIGIDSNSGRVIAWEKDYDGGGKAIFLGLSWIHAMREHEQMLFSLLNRIGVKRTVSLTNPNIWPSLLRHGNKNALFLMNLFTSDMETGVFYNTGDPEVILPDIHKIPAITVKCIEF